MDTLSSLESDGQTTGYLWTIIVYLVVLIGVGAYRSLRVRTQDDFMVAGRKL